MLSKSNRLWCTSGKVTSGDAMNARQAKIDQVAPALRSAYNGVADWQIVLGLCGLLLIMGGCRLVNPISRPANVEPELTDSGDDQSYRKSIAATLAKSVRTKEPEKPSNNRNWRPDLALLPVADINGDRIKLYHIRDCTYRTEEDYDVRHFDREFKLTDVRSVDFIVVPFQNTPALAHTMLSFGLSNGEQFVVSVEGRLEQGEKYSTLGGALNGYELMVVIGTERDLILLRTEVRNVDVYLYPTRVTPQQAQRLFVAMLNRANQLAREPEFYDLLTNNCTTNIVDHINRLKPGSIPNDLRVLLPGHSDRLAYDLGLLAVNGPFDQIRQACHVNLAAHLNYGAKDFSSRIRQR